VATKADAPALINLDAPPYPAGDERVIFSTKVQVNQLPPGKYVLRAIFSEQGKAVKTLTRPFEVAPPKVLMTSAEGTWARCQWTASCSCRSTRRRSPRLSKRDDAVKPRCSTSSADRSRRRSRHRSTRESASWPRRLSESRGELQEGDQP
jgi:hypothetical protein